jgi:hypothetical protein
VKRSEREAGELILCSAEVKFALSFIGNFIRREKKRREEKRRGEERRGEGREEGGEGKGRDGKGKEEKKREEKRRVGKREERSRQEKKKEKRREEIRREEKRREENNREEKRREAKKGENYKSVGNSPCKVQDLGAQNDSTCLRRNSIVCSEYCCNATISALLYIDAILRPQVGFRISMHFYGLCFNSYGLLASQETCHIL